VKIRTALFAASALREAMRKLEENIKIELKDLNPKAKEYFDRCRESDIEGIKELNALAKKLIDEATE
jgi:hypothetical protein